MSDKTILGIVLGILGSTFMECVLCIIIWKPFAKTMKIGNEYFEKLIERDLKEDKFDD